MSVFQKKTPRCYRRDRVAAPLLSILYAAIVAAPALAQDRPPPRQPGPEIDLTAPDDLVPGVNLQGRLDKVRARVAERQSTIDERRAKDRANTLTRWGTLVNEPAAHEELKVHAQRLAFLGRIQELAEAESHTSIVERALRAALKESKRHVARMQALAASNTAAGSGASR